MMNKSVVYASNPALSSINCQFRGNICIDNRFYNTDKVEKAPFLDVIKWKLTANPQREVKLHEEFSLPVQKVYFPLPAQGDCLIWLGHNSFFIRINGKTIITDPCFYNVGHIPRTFELPCMLGQLPPIDYIIVSHLHRDHFDIRSVRELLGHSPQAQLLLPLGGTKLLRYIEVNFPIKSQEAGWFQKYATSSAIEVFFMPARHWNRRGLTDYNTVLWGSFVIRAGGKTVFFAGDTGFSDHFEQIAQYFLSPDICLMPIGAYSPSFLMQREHMSPREAVDAFHILKGKCFIPMHYGTYDLSDEPMGEPIRLLEQLRRRINGSLEVVPAGGLYQF